MMPWVLDRLAFTLITVAGDVTANGWKNSSSFQRKKKMKSSVIYLITFRLPAVIFYYYFFGCSVEAIAECYVN